MFNHFLLCFRRPLHSLSTGRRKFRCETCTGILLQGVKDHGPSATGQRRAQLLSMVGLSGTQLDNWLTNRRRAERKKSEKLKKAQVKFARWNFPENLDVLPDLQAISGQKNIMSFSHKPTCNYFRWLATDSLNSSGVRLFAECFPEKKVYVLGWTKSEIERFKVVACLRTS